MCVFFPGGQAALTAPVVVVGGATATLVSCCPFVTLGRSSGWPARGGGGTEPQDPHWSLAPACWGRNRLSCPTGRLVATAQRPKGGS